MKRLLPFSNRE